MPEFLVLWLAVTWDMIARSALFLFLGFLLAGLIRMVLTPEAIRRLFGAGWFTQVIKAALIGIPLPLCSCAVLPVAAQLRRSGLSRPGTVSFLISTPETGVDSILLSIRLLGPIMAIARPVAALMTAALGGTAIRLLNDNGANVDPYPEETEEISEDGSLAAKTGKGVRYVLGDLMPELSYYLFWGFLLAGLVAAIMPQNTPAANLPAGWQYFLMIAVSLPLYVCATSSTPLAAVMLAIGLLPGAVLAFLLVGPATNLTSLVVQRKILGLKGTLVMTASIVTGAVLTGILLDLTLEGKASAFPGILINGEHSLAWYDIAAGLLLTFIMAYYTLAHYWRKFKKRYVADPAQK